MQAMEKNGISRPWIHLPHDILSAIIIRLPLIGLLSFRGTCKDFRSATAGISAQIQSTLPPWILMFNKNECIFYNDHESKTYKSNISDLDGVICLAFYQGWLLFKDGSVFFFCPFSLAKIYLPDFPHHRFDGHVASFSDVPTSPECIVTVINAINQAAVEGNVISKGEKSWTRHVLRRNLSTTIVGATFDVKNRIFYYMDKTNSLLAFSVKDKKWQPYQVVKAKSKDSGSLPYYYAENMFLNKMDHFRGPLGFEDDEDIAVCGFTYQNQSKYHLAVYLNEYINVLPDNKRLQRAVWIQPRFFEADRNHHW